VGTVEGEQGQVTTPDVHGAAGEDFREPEEGPDTEERPAPEEPKEKKRRSRGRKVLLAAVALLGVGILLVVGTVWWAYDHYTGRVDRIPNAFPTNVPKSAQPKAGAGGENYLLVGIDARSDLPTTGSNAKAPEWKPGAQRSDTMMLVHLPENRKHAYVVSLPRDSWVPIPGHGHAKLNAAFSWGGPPLLIDTVQRLTDVKVDHLAVIDWSGFKKLTDAVGGVDLTVEKTVPRRNGGGRWTAGKHHMNGAEALDYVRERYGLPRGDLDRTHRQQAFLRAVAAKAMTPGNFANPLKAKKLLDSVTDTVSVDDRFSSGHMRDLMWDMKGVHSGDMIFMNAPITGTDMVKGQSIVRLDEEAMDPLWEAMRNDTMPDYLKNNPGDRLGTSVP
jgi:LCP family protein required for cell wall assembly